MTEASDSVASRVRLGVVLPGLVLVTGSLFSLILYAVIRGNIEGAARERFDHQAAEARRVIEARIQSYAGVLHGVRALFGTQRTVSRAQFHRYVESLDLKNRFPGFEVVNFAIPIRAEDKKRFEDEVRRDTSIEPGGYPEFTIKPPGDRSEYHVLVYLEPMAANKFALGLDISSANAAASNHAAALEALQSARDSGRLTASGRLIRVMREKAFVGLSMRLPVYRQGVPLVTKEDRRAAYVGSVGAGFNVENLMRGALDEQTLQFLRFRLYDTGPASDRRGLSLDNERLLFDSNQLIRNSNTQSQEDGLGYGLSQNLPIEVGGRKWEIHFSAPEKVFVDQVNRLFPSIVLAGGLLSSFLLFGILYSLSSSRTRAVKIADQITKDLRESEERFRLIAENAYDMIALLSPEGRLVYLNPAYAGLIENYKALVGTESFQSVHPEDRERVRKTFFDTVRDGVARRAEFRFLLPSGEARYMESQVSSVSDSKGNVVSVIKVSRDVTERRQKNEALQAREVQLQEAQALANLGSWEWDMLDDSRQWSEQLSRIFGVARDHLPSAFYGFYPFVHPEDRERTARAARKALHDGNAYECQFRIVRPDGEIREIHSKARVDRDASGRAVRVLGTCQDITERKRAEEQAKVSQERFRMMVENVRDYAIYMLDTKGHVTSWNLGAERIAGYRAEEIIGRHYSCFFLPDHAIRGDAGIQLEFAALQGRYESEGWRVRKDGSRFWAHVIATPLRDADGKLRGFSEISHDITERKRDEEDLHNYADRLRVTSRRLVEIQESERRLIARELHDLVGQNLTGLGLNLSIVAGGLPAKTKPELAARLDDCSMLVRDMVDAIRNLMTELRPHTLDEYGLPAALRSLAAGFSRRTGIQVAFDGDSTRTDFPKTVDLAMFRIAQEALTNIAKHSSADRVEIAIRRRDGRATLSVQDNGVGFDPSRVGSTEGSGWGLLIMRERAEAVGAQFVLRAQPDVGVEVLVEYRAAAEI